MGTIGDLSRRIRADGKVSAEDAQALLAAVREDKTVSPEEKTELTNLLKRFADAFDAAGWSALKDASGSLGIAVGDNAPLSLANRPELAEVASGKKTLSTANRKDPAAATIQRALMSVARLEGKAAFTLPRGGADGDLGAESTAAIQAFQADRKLPVTGVVDAATLAKLAEALGKPPAPQVALTSPRFTSDPLLARVASGELALANGAKGDAVTLLQNALIDLGYPMPKWGADGGFGGECKAALSQFQKDRGLAVTGRLDRSTLIAIDRAAPAVGARAIVYPEYDQMFRDGVLDVTLGVGFDEDGSDLTERKVILDALAARGFSKLDVAALDDAALKAKGLDPAKIDRKGTYYLKAFDFQGKPVKALVKYIDRDTPASKERFGSGFVQSDLVLYGGHARYGSGPDFDDINSPAGNFVLGVNAKGHQDGTLTPAYDEHIRGVLKDSGNDLEKSKLTDAYQLMFFSGCTTKNYLDELRGIPKNKSQENLDFIGSDEPLFWNNIGGNVITLLDGVMGGKSENDIEKELFQRNTVPFTADGFGGNRYHP